MKFYWAFGIFLFFLLNIPLAFASFTCRNTVVMHAGGAFEVPLISLADAAAINQNPEHPTLAGRFAAVIHDYRQRVEAGAEASDDLLLESFRQSLIDQVPAHSIESRLTQLQVGAPDGLLQALGYMTLAETLELLHGGDHLHPSPHSLLGKYLAETGASVTVRGFSRVPNQHQAQDVGPERLVVSVSPDSYASYLKYLARPQFFSVHAHALISTNGKLFSYNNQGDDFRLPSAGYPLPQVVLTTSETQRLWVVFDLLVAELGLKKSYGVQNRAMHPWSVPNYCGPGGYVNCTAWIANMPIGDERVDHYHFPAVNDAAGGVQQFLSPYQLDEELVTRVWKTPGHAQLATILDLQDENVLGNLASPGYLIHNLLANTPVERVPYVLYVTDRHRAPIPDKFAYTVEQAN